MPAAEIVVAALAHFEGVSSLSRQLFDVAAGETGYRAVVAWRCSSALGQQRAARRGDPRGLLHGLLRIALVLHIEGATSRFLEPANNGGRLLWRE